MTSKAKFFITCAVVFVIGFALASAGVALGGISDLTDSAKNPNLAVIENDYEFASIESTGEIDLRIVGSRYYDEVLKGSELTGIKSKAGRVIVIYDKDQRVPEVSADGRKLSINGGSQGIHFNINPFKQNYSPTVIVLCKDEELDSVNVSSAAGDIDIKGVDFKTSDIGLNAGDIEIKEASFSNINIGSDSGDVKMDGITSGGIKVECDAGDIELSGKLEGITDVYSDAGDIDADISGSLKDYTIDLHTEAGDILLGKSEINGGSYSQKGGKDKLKLETDAGDIELDELSQY